MDQPKPHLHVQRPGLQCIIHGNSKLVVRNCETKISQWYDIKPLTGSLCSTTKESGNISVVVGRVNKSIELALKNRFQPVSLTVANVLVGELFLDQHIPESCSVKNDVSREMLPGKIEFLRVAVRRTEDMSDDELRPLTPRRPSSLKLVNSVICENVWSDIMQLNSFSTDERTISQSISLWLNVGLDRRTYISLGTKRKQFLMRKKAVCAESL